MKTKWPKQLTANVFSYPSSPNSSKVGNATPAFPTMISSLFGLNVSSSSSLKFAADNLALSIEDRSRGWKWMSPDLGSLANSF